jgi:glyoxylase-like metal-dependent hydrolase (beta-lactamase superfamily II)
MANPAHEPGRVLSPTARHAADHGSAYLLTHRSWTSRICQDNCPAVVAATLRRQPASQSALSVLTTTVGTWRDRSDCRPPRRRLRSPAGRRGGDCAHPPAATTARGAPAAHQLVICAAPQAATRALAHTVQSMDRDSWVQPGAHEEAPGVYRIPLPLPGDYLKAVNVYAVADGDGVVMIDGGWALSEAEELLTESLGRIGYGLADIREFLVTHAHRDHYTQAVAVRRAVGSPVCLGEGERASLAAIRTMQVHPNIATLYQAGALELSRMLAEDPREPDVTNWEDPDRWLSDGIDIALRTRTLRVIATPGHTHGHVVFHDVGANALFAGDHVLPHITPSIGFELVHQDSPLRDYLSSLRLVRALPDARLLPAHGPVGPSTHTRVEELLDHHEQRLTETADAVAGGASTAFEVATVLTWTRRNRTFGELDVFNKMMAVHETMAHLEVLVERGWLTRSRIDAIAHFAPC